MIGFCSSSTALQALVEIPPLSHPLIFSRAKMQLEVSILMRRVSYERVLKSEFGSRNRRERVAPRQMRGLRAPHSLYVRAEKRRNQAVLEMRGFLNSASLRPFDSMGIDRGILPGDRVMMKSPPASPLEVSQAEFALQFLVVAFNSPSQLDDVDENRQRRVFGQGREPVFGRLRLALWPFDDEPFDGMRRNQFVVARRRPDPRGGEARRQGLVGGHCQTKF